MEKRRNTVTVAVVGTGLAGLAAAHSLQSANACYEDGQRVRVVVHLLEKSQSFGMDAASISIKSEKGGEIRIDTPMRSINGGSHSRVKRLYDQLGVPLVKSDFSYSFSKLLPPSTSATKSPASAPSLSNTDMSPLDDLPSTPPPPYSSAFSSRAPTPTPSKSSSSTPLRPPQRTTLLYSGASGLSWPPLPFPSHLSSLPSQLCHLLTSLLLTLSYLYLLLLAFFYHTLGLARPAGPATSSLYGNAVRRARQRFSVAAEPVDRWAVRHRLPEGMRELLKVLMAAVATIGVGQAGEMPIGEVLEYITSTFLASHYVTSPSFGVRGIVRALIAKIPPSQIHLGVTIISFSPLPSGGYAVHYSTTSPDNPAEVKEETLEVDHLIFATQADQAALLLSTFTPSAPSSSSPTPSRTLSRLLAALRTFTYERALVTTHTDTSLLPPSPSDRRDLNLAVFSELPTSSFADRKKVDEKAVDEKSKDDNDEDEGDVLPPSFVQTTHILSSSAATATSSSTTYLQTTNPLFPISPCHTLSKTWFSRAVVNARSQAVVPLFSASAPPGASLQGLNLREVDAAEGATKEGEDGGGEGGVWFVGSYLAPGIPLLEGCVTSAEGVAVAILRREVAAGKRGGRRGLA